ncbi:hypothetical protein DQ04_10661010 [Trypanosoma grayi]|uniref:hypothetical protein n=1 Tax=Trypanosoma grayi TaxID=71804 RepID=UPI0004F40921|nr:hypothetical protein DQ04_10661010 [Trypanosoma grayi]KEG07170.1 hypothetical protein DQ04_10661010 [Trypanosoma grayi]
MLHLVQFDEGKDEVEECRHLQPLLLLCAVNVTAHVRLVMIAAGLAPLSRVDLNHRRGPVIAIRSTAILSTSDAVGVAGVAPVPPLERQGTSAQKGIV